MNTAYIPSSDRTHRLHIVIWDVQQQPCRGIVQISHGMCEYASRYDVLATQLNREGYIVIGNDHLGHGHTAGIDDDLGYFCPTDMSKTVVHDLHAVTDYAKQQYPNLPVFLFGHSMGSFMARRYIMEYGDELRGVILSGTGQQPDIALIAGKAIAAIIGKIKGDRHRSAALKRMAFGSYNARIPNPRTHADWLTKDTAIVDRYLADKHCTFSFTVNGYRTLFDVLSYIQNPRNIAKIPKSLPIYMISGADDPVGGYGKGVANVFAAYQRHGIRDIALKLYDHDRHELTNETDRETVFADIDRWLSEHGQ